MADDVAWMSYQELADRLGIGIDSAKNLVRRKRWSRQAGNDGLARVGVPMEHLAEHDRGARPPVDPPTEPPTCPPLDPAIGGALTALERHVERLERELAAAVADRDAERARAAQVEALRAVLDVERQRVADAQADADRWRQVATEPRGLFGWIKQARAAMR